MTIEKEGTQQLPISPSEGEVFCAHAENLKWHPAARVCLFHPFMNLVILSWMKISAYHCTSSTKAKRNCVEMNFILFFYMKLARLKEVERKKKNLNKIGQIGIFDPLWSDPVSVYLCHSCVQTISK